MTPPPPRKCGVSGCDYTTTENLTSHEQGIRELELHYQMVHVFPTLRQPTEDARTPRLNCPKPAQLPRPELQEDASEQEWDHWKAKWERYKRSCLVGMDKTMVVDHLWACCTKELESAIWKQIGKNVDTEAELLELMKRLGVKKRNIMLNKVVFLDMMQDAGEPVKLFTARLKGQAAMCNFTLPKGECDYGEKMVQHQLIRGLHDQNIQEHVLSLAATEEGSEMDLNRMVKVIEAKENAKTDSESLHKSTVCRMSDYRKGVKVDNTAAAGSGGEANCVFCKRKGHGANATEEVRKQSCPAFDKECFNCKKKGHFKQACKSKKKEKKAEVKEVEETGEDPLVGSMSGTSMFCRMSVESRKGKIQLVDHHEYSISAGTWIKQRPEKHPSVEVRASVCMTAYDHVGLQRPKRKAKHAETVRALSLPDTGAQVTIAGMNLVHSLGMTKGDLVKVKTGVSAANNGKLTLLGGVFMNLTREGEETRQLVYVAEEATHLYLSKTACRDLGMVSEDFPEGIGKVSGCTATEHEDDTGEPCDCPKRIQVPPPPSLPFEVKENEEDRAKLEKFILEYYKSSAFNQCERQPLPLMDGHPPLELHVEEDATPYSVQKARPVPLHWQKKVKQGLDMDCNLEVLEQVPMNDPDEWCADMNTVAKKNGDPRRTIDFQKLNKSCKRQTHAVEAPFHQACAVPANTRRTVLDAWNGYHSVPLAEKDRSKTTFLTPWGRYRYKTAPQGFLAAGDAYTARYDRIIEGFKDMKKCVDDSILWSRTLEDIFHHTCKYISHCAGAGISFNPSKFRFGMEEVEFVGFKITKNGVQPTEEYIASIRDFPEPKDITGARSWFGLINQVNYAYSESSLMEPFRKLLHPGMKFEWTEEMARVFRDSKDRIISAVKEGIKTFQVGRWTCLATDWSKLGLGFALMQKTCKCEEITPSCCKGGWQLTYAGSRFTTSAESRYHPVEGEALSAAWALHKTRHFTLGCRKLVLAVDHKPLLKIFGDRELGEIENPRILNFKEKTLRWRFKVVHVPGVLHKIADATSRSPVKGESQDGSQVCCTTGTLEEAIRGGTMAGLCSIDERSLRAVTWKELNQESSKDEVIAALRSLIENGAPEEKEEWPPELREYFAKADVFSCVDEVVLMGHRIVMPQKLRQSVVEVLHSGHCGVTGMVERARELMFWPKMKEALEEKRGRCGTCVRIAPSQPSAPPTPLPTPDFPFQYVSTDYFELAGNHYMVFVCRYSNWITVFTSKNGTTKELLARIREYMGVFGVMEELATDGDTVYVSREAQDFFQRYDIRHRVSSSYFPHSNQRAETAVKAAKRMLQDNTGPGGSLDTDGFLTALLQHRNTPSSGLGMSPSQVVFGRKVKDLLPIPPGSMKWRSKMRPEWRELLEYRDLALARRHGKRGQDLEEHTRKLRKLQEGEVVSVQNQKGNKPTRWDITGTVVEVWPNDQYVVKVDGSGRLTTRNRKFLRPIKPVKEMLKQQLEEEINAPRRSDRIAGKAAPASEVNVFRPWE